MKIKTKGEIVKEAPTYGNVSYENGVREGAHRAFLYFAERVEFYKKYKDEPIDLCQNNRNLFNKFLIQKMEYKKDEEKFIYVDISTIEQHYIKEYNDWLFTYCFGDVK